jgi:uncharacterized protein YukE
MAKRTPEITTPRGNALKDVQALAEQTRQRLDKLDVVVDTLTASLNSQRSAQDVSNLQSQVQSLNRQMTQVVRALANLNTTSTAGDITTYQLTPPSDEDDTMTRFRTGPLALTTSAVDLLNPPTLTGGDGISMLNTYIEVDHIRVVNTTGAVVNLTLNIGATGGSAPGTEFLAAALPIAANSGEDFYPSGARLDVADFLTGRGSAVGLTITIEGRIGVAP